MLNEISPVERIDTGLDLGAQRFQFQRIFLSPLLEHAERLTHRFARILILACLHDTFDEGVLLGSQADVTSGNVRISLKIGIVCQPWQSLPMPSLALASKPANDLGALIEEPMANGARVLKPQRSNECSI